MKISKCILLLLFAITFAKSRAKLEGLPSLKQGNSLKAEEESNFLVSPGGTFSSGFYKVGANASCYSIWFTNTVDKTVVWMANRDKPISESGSKLTLHGAGNLVLTDAQGSVVWETNTILKEIVELQLLETGNLVLTNQDGTIIWQSFNSPTDTLLPTQPLTKNKTLVSMRSQGTYLSGYYNLKFDDNNILFLIYNGPQLSSVYWPELVSNVFVNGRNPYNSTRMAILDEAGHFVSSDNMLFYASDYGVGPKRRLTMDYDGVLRLYSLNESTGLWELSWLPAGVDSCLVQGLCGEYGICTYKLLACIVAGNMIRVLRSESRKVNS
ncbi:putative receptor protein kinase ZmPK1 [Argentina anserina]|uniref:putative receptor protein kinase ZmPK1 n=1 Tax=Argentina anserina TaxID=57926 RepID=UPI00217685ED|nr:putative receptor protein kinase ZmPK1 [Potentilla anserina]